MNHRTALTGLACLLLAGCASNGEATVERQRPSDTDFVTGSRIPQKNKAGVSTMSREEWERAKESASMPTRVDR